MTRTSYAFLRCDSVRIDCTCVRIDTHPLHGPRSLCRPDLPGNHRRPANRGVNVRRQRGHRARDLQFGIGTMARERDMGRKR